MSSFGESNYKTNIESELAYIFEDAFGKPYRDASDSDKKEFLVNVLDVLRYMFEN